MEAKKKLSWKKELMKKNKILKKNEKKTSKRDLIR